MRRTSLALGTALVLSLPELAAAQGGAPPRAARPTPQPGGPSAAPATGTAPGAAEPAVAPPPETPEGAPESAPSDVAPAQPAPRQEPVSAEPRTARPRPVAAPTEDDDVPPPLAPARDTVGGHIAVGAMAGLVLPFGNFRGDLPQTDRLGPGLALGGDITYGVSRTVMLGAYGEVAMPAPSGTWSGTSVSTVAAGGLVRYHLVQGVRFDPWVAAGIGFRRTSNGTASYTGVDWLRLQMGGDWYATSQLGFGPILELALGTFTGASGDSLDTKAVNAHFVLGGRVVFDGPGK